MKRPLTILLTLTMTITMFPFSSSAAEPTKDSLEQVEKNLTELKAVLVDVREEDETNEGYIDGAILVPLSLLNQAQDTEGFGAILAQQIPPKSIIYTYCKAGVRSLAAADILAKFKYDVRALRHGYDDLVVEGFVPAKPKK